MDCTKTVPPRFHVRKLIQWPAPCMNGGASRAFNPPSAAATTPSSVSASEPPKHSTLASPLRHSTPFGMPVVPPV